MKENNWLALLSEVTTVNPEKIEFVDLNIDHRSLKGVGTKVN